MLLTSCNIHLFFPIEPRRLADGDWNPIWNAPIKNGEEGKYQRLALGVLESLLWVTSGREGQYSLTPHPCSWNWWTCPLPFRHQDNLRRWCFSHFRWSRNTRYTSNPSMRIDPQKARDSALFWTYSWIWSIETAPSFLERKDKGIRYWLWIEPLCYAKKNRFAIWWNSSLASPIWVMLFNIEATFLRVVSSPSKSVMTCW